MKDGEESLELPKAGNLGGCCCGVELAVFKAEEKIAEEVEGDSLFMLLLCLFINETPAMVVPSFPEVDAEFDLNVALGPNSFDMFSKAPAAACTAIILLSEFVLVLETDEEVDNNNGDVILCKPGAN